MLLVDKIPARTSLVIFLLFFASGSFANNSSLGLGFGLPYGGLGLKYAYDMDGERLYGGLGLMAYSDYAEQDIGYVLGFERSVLTDHHVLGVSVGKVKASAFDSERYDYFGGGMHYSYYFGGMKNSSWLVGGGVAYGKRDIPSSVANEDQYDKSTVNTTLLIGYQF